jgi:hypothetical protein
LPSKIYLHVCAVCLSVNIVCKQMVRRSLVSPHLLSSCFKTVKVCMQVLIDCQYLLTRNIWYWLIVMIQVMVKVMTQFMMQVTMQVRSWLKLTLATFETLTDDSISFVKSPQKDPPESFETLYSWPHFLCQIEP